MREEKILSSIKKSMENAPIDLLDKIKSQDIMKMTKHDKITEQREKKSFQRTFLPVMSLAASLLFVFGIWQFNENLPDSYVYLDVNPSVEIVTNKKDDVIKLLSFNEDGDRIIQDVDYKGRNMVLLTEELVKKMVVDGYIKGSDDYLLVSVFNKDHEKKQQQKDRLNTSIHNFMEKEEFSPIILLQNIEKTSTIETYAREFGISPSKMTFIRNMIILNPELQVEDLVTLSLRELIMIGRTMELDLESIIQSDDFERIPVRPPAMYDGIDDDQVDDDDDSDDPDKGGDIMDGNIISRDEAIRIALSITEGGTVISVELDQDDDEAEYEIEIIKDGKKYDVEIDGYTGKVLDLEVDDDSDSPDTGGVIMGGNIISRDEAIRIALSITEGGTISSVELDQDDDEVEYEIEIIKDGKKYDIEIDGYTGKVLDFEVEDDD